MNYLQMRHFMRCFWLSLNTQKLFLLASLLKCKTAKKYFFSLPISLNLHCHKHWELIQKALTTLSCAFFFSWFNRMRDQFWSFEVLIMDAPKCLIYVCHSLLRLLIHEPASFFSYIFAYFVILAKWLWELTALGIFLS